MSSAGIPVFYGALDLETARQETLAHAAAGGAEADVRVCSGTFHTITPFRLLDLTSLPPVPGFFSADRRNRASIGFLRSFVEDVAKPIPPDGRKHSEYAPTQVVSEYFRHVYRSRDGLPADGILYPSSRTGGSACALFAGADECCDFADWNGTDEPHRLFLEEGSVHSEVLPLR
jgi:RES domain